MSISPVKSKSKNGKLQVQELDHVQHCLAVEKQSNAELAEGVRRQRRAAAKQDAEAAGREHKHQDEVQELRKVCWQQPCACNSHLTATALCWQ